MLNHVLHTTLKAFGHGPAAKRAKKNKGAKETRPPFPEMTEEDIALISKFAPFTMTGEKRQWALMQAVRYVDRAEIPGDIVECGVWKGGAMLLAKACHRNTSLQRRFYLFDTFAGMSAPTHRDRRMIDDADARTEFMVARRDGHVDWCYAPLEEVRGNFQRFGLLDENVIFCQGPVEDTLRARPLPDQIAILRLDTDWYESTKIELEVLYPRLARGGILIIDDYGWWRGSKEAVEEYFAQRPVFLMPIDHDCRLVVKL